jgi:hypothetical protein
MSELKYEIRVDAGQADAELRRVHTSATTLAGAEREVERAVNQSNAALRQQGPAAKQAATGMQALQQQASKASQVLGKQAAAIAILSQNIGEANGNVGKLVQGAGQMAAAFGAGGPWAAALVGGIALVGQLTAHWQRLNDEQDRAIEKQYEQADAITATTRRLRDENARLLNELDPSLQKQARREQLAELMRTNQLEAERLERLAQGTLPSLRAEAAENKQKANLLRGQNREIARQLQLMTELKNKSAPKGPGVKPPAIAEAEEEFDSETWLQLERGRLMKEASDGRIATMRAEAEERKRLAKEAAQEEIRAERERAHEAQRIMDEKAEAQRRHLEEMAQAQAGYAMQATAIVAGTSQQLIGDLISGQEQALERFGVSIMAQAGQALVSYGIQAIGRGVLELSSPVTAALAPASFAAGAGLVAAGVGLGGVSAGLGNLMGGGGGQRERRLPGSMAAPQQTNGGGTVIQITYAGASGPTADQGGRAVVEGLARAQRRQEAAGPVSR